MIRLVLILVLLVLPALGEDRSAVELDVTGIRSDAGSIDLALCTQPTWLGEECPFGARVSARVGVVRVRIEGVPAGLYAAQAFHDDNDTGVLERPLIGFPRKGFGFSRDAPIRLGPPRFADAAFPVPQAAPAEVVIRYR